MKLQICALLLFASVCLAFDCFGWNNSCAQSHMKCDTGFEPFCEHVSGPGHIIGMCTCDKACNSSSDCSNPLSEGCPPESLSVCELYFHVCHCFIP